MTTLFPPMLDKSQFHCFPLAFLVGFLVASAAAAVRAADADTGPSAGAAVERIEFNRDIRPILSENCFYCHGQDGNKREADMRLDVRSDAIDAGAIAPGDPEASGLVERIHSDDPDLQMPPEKSNRQLTPEQKDLLKRWIAEGAEYQPHWAFTTPVRPEPPEEPPEIARPEIASRESRSSPEAPSSAGDGPWSRSPIDRFIAAKMAPVGLSPSLEAERATLIKRLAIDLTGLPPTPEEVDAFVHDLAPDAYDRLVDKYLSKPGYGERQALPWLDAARYADSNGFQQDGDTWQWLWRDWVVRALNADLPFDQFTIWQLAGDLLPDATVDQKIASGFNRNHLLNGEGGAIPEEQRFVILFDRIDTTATTWLGLTMACAQCHDHKYDPITQKDYYSLLDAFNRVPETGTPQRFSSRIRVAPPLIELPTPENEAHMAALESRMKAIEPQAQLQSEAAFVGWNAAITGQGGSEFAKDLPERVRELLSKTERSEEERKELESGLRKHFNEKVRPSLLGQLAEAARLDALRKELADYKADQIPRVMVMSDDKPRETAILDRGDYLKPLDKVAFATPAFLPPLPSGAPANRLGFAQWLVTPEHPLTARVQVNRMWQHFFGTGIVKTAEDFGVQSEYPTHAGLLDWLAVEFRENSWSTKRMHRQIVLSTTYRQSSRLTPEHRTADSENKYFARASRFRMPSLLLRDWALASCGLLESHVGGAPVYPYQPDAVWEALAITKERDFTYPASQGSDLYRRSLYTFWRRTVSPANMFDASNRQTCRVRLAVTSTPLHSLTTLNDPTWVEAARVLAERVMCTATQTSEQLKVAAQRVLCRELSESELAMLTRAYEKQVAIYRENDQAAQELLAVGELKRVGSLPAAEHAALTQVCLGLFNLDEALTRE